MSNPNLRTIVHEAADINEQRLRDTENLLFTNALMMNHRNPFDDYGPDASGAFRRLRSVPSLLMAHVCTDLGYALDVLANSKNRLHALSRLYSEAVISPVYALMPIWADTSVEECDLNFEIILRDETRITGPGGLAAALCHPQWRNAFKIQAFSPQQRNPVGFADGHVVPDALAGLSRRLDRRGA